MRNAEHCNQFAFMADTNHADIIPCEGADHEGEHAGLGLKGRNSSRLCAHITFLS